MIITTDQAARALLSAGFTGWQVVTMGAIGVAESGLELYADNPNDHDPTKVTYLWPDLGWLQVNTYWARNFMLDPDLGAPYSAVGNALRAFRVWKEAGGLDNAVDGYKRWNTYGTLAYSKALPEARLAARRVGVPV